MSESVDALRAHSTMMEPRNEAAAIVVRMASVVVMGQFAWNCAVGESGEQPERASGQGPFRGRIGCDLGQAADGSGEDCPKDDCKGGFHSLPFDFQR